MGAFTPLGNGTITTFDVIRFDTGDDGLGAGTIACGVVFPDGTTVVQNQHRIRSAAIYASIADAFIMIAATLAHSRQGAVAIRFADDPDNLWRTDGTRVPGSGEDGPDAAEEGR